MLHDGLAEREIQECIAESNRQKKICLEITETYQKELQRFDVDRKAIITKYEREKADDKAAHNEHVSQLLAKIFDLTERLASQKSSGSSSASESKSHRRQIKILREELERKCEQIERLRDAAGRDIAALQARLDEVEHLRRKREEELIHTNEQLRLEVQSLSDRLHRFQHISDRCLSEKDQKNEEVLKLHRREEGLSQENIKLKQESQSKHEEFIKLHRREEELQQLNSKLVAECRELNANLDRIRTEKERNAEDFKQSNSRLIVECRDLNTLVDRLKGERDARCDEILAKHRRIEEELQQSNTRLLTECRDLTSLVERLRSEKELWTRNETKIREDARRDAVAEARRETHDRILALQGKLQQQQDVTQHAQLAILAKDQELRSAAEHIRMLEYKLEDEKRALKNLTSSMKQSEDSIRRLEQKVQEKRESCNELLAEHKELKSQLEEQSEVIQQLNIDHDKEIQCQEEEFTRKLKLFSDQCAENERRLKQQLQDAEIRVERIIGEKESLVQAASRAESTANEARTEAEALALHNCKLQEELSSLKSIYLQIKSLNLSST